MPTMDALISASFLENFCEACLQHCTGWFFGERVDAVCGWVREWREKESEIGQIDKLCESAVGCARGCISTEA